MLGLDTQRSLLLLYQLSVNCWYTSQSASRPVTRDGVKKASEYRQHAGECRSLAKQVPDGEQRKQLLEMARTWDALAEDRDRLTQSDPELNAPDGNKDLE